MGRFSFSVDFSLCKSMKNLPFDPELLKRMYTKSEYCRAYNVSRPTLDKRIKTGEIMAFEIKGADVVLAKAA
jgi:hypothetical protein